MKTHESETCLLSVYRLVATIILQQLSSYNKYRHLQTWKKIHTRM